MCGASVTSQRGVGQRQPGRVGDGHGRPWRSIASGREHAGRQVGAEDPAPVPAPGQPGQVDPVPAADIGYGLVARQPGQVQHRLDQVDARLLVVVDRLAGGQVGVGAVLDLVRYVLSVRMSKDMPWILARFAPLRELRNTPAARLASGAGSTAESGCTPGYRQFTQLPLAAAAAGGSGHAGPGERLYVASVTYEEARPAAAEWYLVE